LDFSLVVQTASPAQRKYSGVLNCISTIISEEGFTALWGGVNLFPTLVYHTLTPLLSNCLPLIIDRVFNISASDSPLLYAFAELSLDTLDLLIRLPVETVRKRLQIQIQAKIPGKRFETVVETRKRPYAGMVDCAYRIIQEEGGPHKRRTKSSEDDQDGKNSKGKFVPRPWYAAWGVRGLYTGLGMHLASNLALFAVGAVTNLQDDGDDW
jgi:fusion and transport protein UGO1